jgi:hypothetical protein
MLLLLKRYIYICLLWNSKNWLAYVDGVHLVNVSWLPIGQQCLGYFFGHMGLLQPISRKIGKFVPNQNQRFSSVWGTSSKPINFYQWSILSVIRNKKVNTIKPTGVRMKPEEICLLPKKWSQRSPSQIRKPAMTLFFGPIDLNDQHKKDPKTSLRHSL